MIKSDSKDFYTIRKTIYLKCCSFEAVRTFFNVDNW